MGKLIPFRLRDRKDDDLAEALEKASEKTDRSDVIRTALRYYLFGKKQRLLSFDLEPEPIELEKKEKDADQLEGDLDKLLGDF